VEKREKVWKDEKDVEKLWKGKQKIKKREN